MDLWSRARGLGSELHRDTRPRCNPRVELVQSLAARNPEREMMKADVGPAIEVDAGCGVLDPPQCQHRGAVAAPGRQAAPRGSTCVRRCRPWREPTSDSTLPMRCSCSSKIPFERRSFRACVTCSQSSARRRRLAFDCVHLKRMRLREGVAAIEAFFRQARPAVHVTRSERGGVVAFYVLSRSNRAPEQVLASEPLLARWIAHQPSDDALALLLRRLLVHHKSEPRPTRPAYSTSHARPWRAAGVIRPGPGPRSWTVLDLLPGSEPAVSSAGSADSSTPRTNRPS